MMNEDLVNDCWNLVWARLRETSIQISVVVTGGGSGAVGRCFGRSGASKHFIDAAVPYSRESLVEYLGGYRPDSYVSQAVVRRMAQAARSRTARWRVDSKDGCLGSNLEIPEQSPEQSPVQSPEHASANGESVGVALTAAMPTEPNATPESRKMRDISGSDSPIHPHFWMSVATDDRIDSWHRVIPAGSDRIQGERMAQVAVAAGIAWAIDPGFGAEIRSKFPL